MPDKKRILSKIDELDSYLDELIEIVPDTFEEYELSIEKKRSCERLLHISIESVIDICMLLVKDLKLGLPVEEEDVFDKLEKKKIFPKKLIKKLREMKGLRNILVHRYGSVDDELVYDSLSAELNDFHEFIDDVLKFTKM
ncbi:MAG: DUF86 domain-containing protein [Candidatus Aenigmarchaeota archaeon]|nr:DUF86 domain-containing protein [Candidatus Aenigmarchaeota archaeon]